MPACVTGPRICAPPARGDRNAHFDVVRLPFPPDWMQKLGLVLGSPLGRLVGYGPTYEPAAPGEPQVAV